MATNENNLDAYNAVEVALGGVGLFLNDMAAVNAIAILEGAAGGHLNMIDGLNAIDLDAGGTGVHLNTLDALNSIVVLKGGLGGHENDLDAINAWVDVAGVASSLLTDLISWHPSEEASGSLLDAHLGHDFTAVNSPGSAAGIVGNARTYLDASTQHFTRTDTDYDFADDDFTVAGWWFTTDNTINEQCIMAKGSLEWIFDVLTGGQLRFLVTDAIGLKICIKLGLTLNNNTWYPFRSWHDSGANLIACQFDGLAPQTLAIDSGGIVTGGNPTLIGTSEAGRNMNGRLDEIAVWSRLLTDDEWDEYRAGITYPG